MTPNQTIESLYDHYEDILEDADFNNGIFTAETEAGEYVINAHGPTNQVWVSSPISGAHHFAWKGEAWVSTKDASLLLDVLLKQEFTTV